VAVTVQNKVAFFSWATVYLMQCFDWRHRHTYITLQQYFDADRRQLNGAAEMREIDIIRRPHWSIIWLKNDS